MNRPEFLKTNKHNLLFLVVLGALLAINLQIV